ncbi:hypothetical protein M595_2906 [Lyngbya aestuarii BL J]|uniref:Uncharacterized protein n=1 Tax=Lyngbya aestuarii BL J TaxID=1348334 RepID=U7QH05_9CYAN|nr:hypothetical protein M595_2906 [Lyngbya aestuarii BL J]
MLLHFFRGIKLGFDFFGVKNFRQEQKPCKRNPSIFRSTLQMFLNQ